MKTSPPSRGNAFAGVAPGPSELPTSGSKRKKRTYHVFINHRGCDVKHNLASNIYHSLEMLKIKAFLDAEELELGDYIPSSIQEAMRSALLHIVILSKNYAQSPWCLAELAFMLKTGTTIFPIFYHVDPQEVRWVDKGKGIYASALSKHRTSRRYTPNMVEEWKEALQTVSNLKGYMLLRKEDDEGKLLKSIVNFVEESIPSKVFLSSCFPGISYNKTKSPICNHEDVKSTETVPNDSLPTRGGVQKHQVKDDEDGKISTWTKEKSKNSKKKLNGDIEKPDDTIVNQNTNQNKRILFYYFKSLF